MRVFNISGPCDPRRHYMIAPEGRLPEARRLVAEGAYFVVHAPRQTGKTTTLRTLAWRLTEEGQYAALHFSCETGEPAGDDFALAERAVLAAMRRGAELHLPPELRPPEWPDAPELARVSAGLAAWAQQCPRPLVLFFDEIDALRGEALRSVLRQLRDGYADRPVAFPHSVVLCGLRDVRDYKVASGGDPERLGTSSPFNIKDESLRLGDFDRDEVLALFAQHTDETGQPLTPEAQDQAWTLTAGQPWLVNALGREIVRNIGVAPPESITAAHFDDAKERLILKRQTHLDSLVARLMEPRVRHVVEPLIGGTLPERDPTYDDSLSYVRSLGLIARDNPLRVANPIDREVIVRVLSGHAESVIELRDPRAFIRPDGRLDLDRLLQEFAAFWCEHGEVLTRGDVYHEVAPQLVIMAYFQRVVNGGGYIDREYGVGRGRIDLLVRWPYTGAGGERCWQREALELKVWRTGEPDPLPKGLTQLDAYLDRLGLDTGTLVVFDRRANTPPLPDRVQIAPAQSPAGRPITLMRA